MDVKGFGHIEVKSEELGQVTAVFATLNVVDSDGDVTLPGAFEVGAEAPISDYGHTSHMEMGGRLPVGKGRIRMSGDKAIMDGQFFLDTPHGLAAFRTVKHLGGIGQWSYGFDTLDSAPGSFGGRQVRFLKRQKVLEFSPTLVGAGVGTQTLSTKGRNPERSGGAPVAGFEYRAAIRPHDVKTTDAPWDAADVIASIKDGASVSDLRSVFAWVDPEADPEMKSAYRFAHHMKSGEANIRACIAGIAALNGARGGTSIPDADRQGVYNHLVAHLRDADRQPPELRSGSADGWKSRDEDGKATFGHYEELAVVLSDWMQLNRRTAEVVALRRKKGRAPLPAASLELQQWIEEEVERHRYLLTSADDEAQTEWLRFIRSQVGA